MKINTGSMHRVLTLLVAFAAAACGGVSFRQPTVDLQGIQLGGLGLSGGTLLVDVRVHNPNSYSLGADQVRYNLSVRKPGATSDTAFTQIAAGDYMESFTVRGGESRTLRIPVEFSYSALGGAGSALMRNGSFVYRAQGTVVARTPIGPRDVPFYKTGTVLMSGAQVR